MADRIRNRLFSKLCNFDASPNYADGTVARQLSAKLSIVKLNE